MRRTTFVPKAKAGEKGDEVPMAVTKRLAILFCVAALLAVLSAAVTVTRSAGSGTAKPTLRIGLDSGLSSPNPVDDGVTASILIIRDFLYAPIVHQKPDGTFTPGLATTWHYFKVKAGANKGFEFTLRHNARFSDGAPVTAQTVVSWLRYFSKNSQGFGNELGPNPTFTAVGKWTVRVLVTVSNPLIPVILSDHDLWGDISAPAAVSNPSRFATNSWGAGPYKLDPSQTVAGDHYTLVPNPYYYDKSKVRWSSIYIKVIPTPSSRLQALQSGQLDVAVGDGNTAPAAKSSGFNVVAGQSLNHTLYFTDLQGAAVKAFADVRVRQAMNYAIDRKAIATALYGKYAQPTSEVITAGASSPKYENYYPYNPSKARSLLAAAGYPDGFTAGVLAFSDQAPEVQAVAHYLDAVGVHLKIAATFGSQFPDKSYGLIQAFSGVYITRWVFYLPSGYYNSTFKTNYPDVNQLYYGGLKAADPYASWQKMFQLITERAYFIPILTIDSVYFVSKKVGGVVTSDALEGFVLPIDWYPKS